MESHEVVKALGALAHPARLDVFRALVVAGADGLTPGAMQEAQGIAATSLSFHLKELAAAGLVAAERQGRHLVYRADFTRMQALLDFLTANCCQGAACGVEAAAVATDCAC
jgi:DNA-binding transcriptional ArsR family regulator